VESKTHCGVWGVHTHILSYSVMRVWCYTREENPLDSQHAFEELINTIAFAL